MGRSAATLSLYLLQVMEVETEEAQRRAEIAQADRDSSYKFRREVRREKSHWKITSHRKNVILRNRPRYQAIIQQVRCRFTLLVLRWRALVMVTLQSEPSI